MHRKIIVYFVLSILILGNATICPAQIGGLSGKTATIDNMVYYDKPQMIQYDTTYNGYSPIPLYSYHVSYRSEDRKAPNALKINLNTERDTYEKILLPEGEYTCLWGFSDKANQNTKFPYFDDTTEILEKKEALKVELAKNFDSYEYANFYVFAPKKDEKELYLVPESSGGPDLINAAFYEKLRKEYVGQKIYFIQNVYYSDGKLGNNISGTIYIEEATTHNILDIPQSFLDVGAYIPRLEPHGNFICSDILYDNGFVLEVKGNGSTFYIRVGNEIENFRFGVGGHSNVLTEEGLMGTVRFVYVVNYLEVSQYVKIISQKEVDRFLKAFKPLGNLYNAKNSKSMYSATKFKEAYKYQYNYEVNILNKLGNLYGAKKAHDIMNTSEKYSYVNTIFDNYLNWYKKNYNLSDEDVSAIKNSRIRVGMSRRDVHCAWGYPYFTIGEDKECYLLKISTYGLFDYIQLNFKDDKLISIEKVDNSSSRIDNM